LKKDRENFTFTFYSTLEDESVEGENEGQKKGEKTNKLGKDQYKNEPDIRISLLF
jgi:hypothetical protein